MAFDKGLAVLGMLAAIGGGAVVLTTAVAEDGSDAAFDLKANEAREMADADTVRNYTVTVRKGALTAYCLEKDGAGEWINAERRTATALENFTIDNCRAPTLIADYKGASGWLIGEVSN